MAMAEFLSKAVSLTRDDQENVNTIATSVEMMRAIVVRLLPRFRATF